VGELSRNHPQVANADGKCLLVEPGTLHENPGREHRYQDEVRHPWRADRWKFVAERDHLIWARWREVERTPEK
jgi:hypothetical protein